MIKFRRNRKVFAEKVLRAATFGASMLCTSSWLTSSAQAQLSWDPAMTGPAVSGGAGAWDTTSSFWWNGTIDTTWTDGNSAAFAGSPGIVTLAGPRSASGLTFATTTGYILSGSILTLTAPASVSVGTGVSATIDSNVAGTDGLNVTGGGTLILNNNNTGLLSGAVAITGPGTVLAAGALTTSAFGSGGITTSASAATSSGNTTIAGGNGAVISNNITDGDGTGFQMRGLTGVTAPAAGGTGAGDVVTFSGAISGSGPVNFGNSANNFSPTSFSTVVLTNTANNWTGQTTVTYGMLVVGASNVMPSTSSVLLNLGGTVSQMYIPSGVSQQLAKITGNGAITLNGSLTVGDNSDFSMGATFVGTGSWEKVGSGTMSLNSSSASPNFSGPVKLSAGRVKSVDNTNFFGNESPTNILTFDGGTLVTGSTVTMNRPIVIGAGGAYFDTTSNSNELVLKLAGSNQLTGSGTIHKLSKIRLSLQSANPVFSGPWDIGGIVETGNRGSVRVGNGGAFGDNSATNIITIRDYGTMGAGLASNQAASVSIPQKVVIAGTDPQPAIISSEQSGSFITFTGVVSGSGTLVIGQRGNLIPTNNNTFSGPIWIISNNGSLGVASDANLGDGSATNQLIRIANSPPGSGIGIGNNNCTIRLLGNGVTGGHNLEVGPGGGTSAFSTVDTNGFNGAFGTVTMTASTSRFIKAGTVGGTLTVNSVRGPGSVTVTAGKLLLAPNGQAPGVSVVNTTAITPAVGATSAQLDISDNHLIDHSTGVGTLGTGNTYSGITGLIQSGRTTANTWTGNGIVTSQTLATTGTLTGIGVASAQQVKGLANPGDTAVWAGQTVTGSDTLVMYTYGGDANLDGKLNVDDYGRIDSNIGLGTAGWYNGDFNYDGKVNVDDYGVIDSNIGIQGPPFFTASGINEAASGVAAVPEPATVSVISIMAALGIRRRRRQLPSP
jgi:fibronectin-binding autotransporter adhesin